MKVEAIIQEENTPTGGRFQCRTFIVDVGADAGEYSTIFSFPIPIGILSAYTEGRDEIKNDEGALHIGEDTTIGVTTQAISTDDTVINVQISVIENIKIGFWVSIDGDDFGRVIAIDNTNNTITVETPATKDYDSGKLVKMTAKMCPFIVFPGSGIIKLGEAKIGASHLSANTSVKIIYNRKTSGDAHKFYLTFEYLY